MPPAVLWALGAIGAVALVKLLASASRKANQELDEVRRGRTAERPVESLERDPVSGEYRPRKQ